MSRTTEKMRLQYSNICSHVLGSATANIEIAEVPTPSTLSRCSWSDPEWMKKDELRKWSVFSNDHILP